MVKGFTGIDLAQALRKGTAEERKERSLEESPR
jgi:hypothetical protein